MLRWLWDNLSSLLLAFILALTVWLAAVSAEDPIEERTIASSIPIELRDMPGGLLLTEEPTRSARITLRAPSSVWNDLSPNDIQIWADLSGLEGGVHRIDLEHEIPLRPIEVTQLEPSSITVRAETAGRTQLPIEVEISGEPAVGYRATQPRLEPTTAVLTGPSSAVQRVARVQAAIDISGRSQAIDEQIDLAPLGTTGETVPDVELDPESVQLTIGIEDLGGYRSVVVSPKIEGEVEPGYQLTRITVSPTLVRVFSADPQVISELSGFVETQPVSLEGATSDFERRVGLALPEGVSIVGEQSVIVGVSISPIETSVTATEDVEFQGLEAGLFAQASPNAVNLILIGPLPTLDDLQPTDVRVVLDLVGLEQGAHQITPDVIVASPDIQVQSVLPDTVEVVISDEPPPTPTPLPES